MTLTQFFLICTAIYGLYKISNFAYRKRYYLIKNGIPALATVVNIGKTGMEIGSGVGARPLMDIVLTFEIEGIKKRVVIDQDLDARDIPKVGDKVDIRVHPEDHNKVLIV